MKHPKLLGLMIMALTLFVSQSCKKDEACEEKTWYHDGDADGEGDSGDTKKACDKPDGYVANANDPDDSNDKIFSGCTKVTYYLDNDGDTFGNPDQSMELCDGVTIPAKYVTNNTDPNDLDAKDFPGCETVTYYLDDDGDTFGDPDQSLELCNGVPAPNKYVTDNTDCDDTNPNVNPGAEEAPNDGIDSNCDGEQETVIWTGPNKNFTKNASDDWTDPQYQDMITEKVTFTRQDNDYLFNFTWWEENIGGDAPIHGQDASDLAWEFWGPDINPFSDITGYGPTGGTKGVRWALLDTGDYPNTAWSNFEFYGALGNNSHFYSLHNVAGMAWALDIHYKVNSVVDDFSITYLWFDPDPNQTQSGPMSSLIGKELGVWLKEENIYFTLKITEWTPTSEGGTITYERSTPITL